MPHGHHWTITIPNRGTMMAQGLQEKTFDPPVEFVTTVNDSGNLVGGTGEFEKVKGTFKETDRVQYISPATGVLTVDDILEFSYR